MRCSTSGGCLSSEQYKTKRNNEKMRIPVASGSMLRLALEPSAVLRTCAARAVAGCKALSSEGDGGGLEAAASTERRDVWRKRDATSTTQTLTGAGEGSDSTCRRNQLFGIIVPLHTGKQHLRAAAIGAAAAIAAATTTLWVNNGAL